MDSAWQHETVEALHDLRKARRERRLADVHWVDALYRVYITALGTVAATLYAANFLPTDEVRQSTLDTLLDQGPAVLGFGFALALFFSFRSGARGGPLTLEAPSVFHELLAPLDRSAAMRGPAFKQIRFMAFAGMILGAAVGYLGSRRLPEDAVGAIVTSSFAFAVAGVGSVGAALVFSGRRLGIWTANLAGLALLAWSAADVAAGTHTSPATLLGDVAFWGLEIDALALVGVVLFLVVAVVGLLGAGGISIEAARRRASLVAQLRFAATLQDVRTVVLLRRQLAQERSRTKPWMRLGGRGRRHRLFPAWRRDWQSVLRYPLVRFTRMGALSIVAGVSLGFVWNGVTPLFLLAALALYLVAYDCTEPLAQEIDHPARWGEYPQDSGTLLIQHLLAAGVLMVICCGVAAGAACLVAPPEVVAALAPIVILPVAGVAVSAAAVSTALGAPDSAKLAGMGADMMGFVMMARLAGPPVAVIISLVPLLAAGSNPDAVNSARVFGGEQWMLLIIGGAVLWMRSLKPERI